MTLGNLPPAQLSTFQISGHKNLKCINTDQIKTLQHSGWNFNGSGIAGICK